MKQFAMALLLMMTALLPTGLKACDCGCDDPPAPPVHFKDGIPPIGPVNDPHGFGDSARYDDNFAFRDYGPAAPPVQPYTPAKPNS